MDEVSFSDFAAAHGHFFARDVQSFFFGQPWIKVRVNSLEPLNPSDVSGLQVPAGAQLAEARSASPANLTPPRALKRIEPEFPPEANRRRLEGVVWINGVVGTDGRLADSIVLGGPQVFQQSALECARRWLFKPAELNGKPVSVEVNVEVHFLQPGTKHP